MRAQVAEQRHAPLALRDVPRPVPGPGEVLVAVEACAVCRTDLHVIDGELANPRYPIIPGHQIVGAVVARGAGVDSPAIGARVGVAWLGRACGDCAPCRRGSENLCRRVELTGYTRDGGFADFAVADARYVLAIPERYTAVEAAPLLCGAAIGYRALRFAGEPARVRRLGLYGFGSAAHLVTQLALAEGREVYAFVRPGDERGKAFARAQGAAWADDSTVTPLVELDAAILFAPDGTLVPRALAAVGPGGTVVCAGIHMSDIPSFPYSLLWEERAVRSVANLTHADGEALLARALQVRLSPRTSVYALADANRALADLRDGRLVGTAVLVR